MKKIYMTFLLLMIAIVSFAEDEVVKNGIRYSILGNEGSATLIDKELTDIVVDPEVTIGGKVYPVTYVSENSYSVYFRMLRRLVFLLNVAWDLVLLQNIFQYLKNGKSQELRLKMECLYWTNVCIS